MIKYSSGLVSESFWFVEFKKIIKLKHEGISWEEIKDLCLKENLLGVSKEYRAKRIYGYLKNRISLLDEDIFDIFIMSDLSTQKIIDLMSIAKQNRLFFEFLYEVYREKVLLGETELTDSDINIFFNNKQQQSEDIGLWTDVTLRRLRSSYMNFMVDAGLLTVVNKQKQITPPILDVALERYLVEKNEVQLFKAITGRD
ncbi:DUF1819 family protein [Turicibacter bilis]|uniref:DUF1819 family protein n=1 Tax=Turicibacter bilis TaxID=2735723 RepID=A0A9Q9CH20_9FIRM|nr:DUF1819 family protein [Turicibacter bilis]MBS3198947.1 DUF1819 family protein [Turicibacter bilis]UUF08490.1 DUF1819 family protein [Turicibacter bilis]